MKDAVLTVARHVLTGVGVYLVSKGVLTEDAANSVVGAIVTLASVAWEVIATKKLSAAKAA